MDQKPIRNKKDKLGLLRDIAVPENIILESKGALAICDKYPKAKHHFLVLPKTDIPTIFDLRSWHLPLLEELHKLALKLLVMRQLRREHFKIGFHAVPSMQQLHMHVISKDFVSDYMDNIQIWNSFNTDLFLRFEDLFHTVKTRRKIWTLRPAGRKTLYKKRELLCNQCEFVTEDLMLLKGHLLEHWTNMQN